MLLLLLVLEVALAAASPPHILFVVGDDLGFSDLGYRNEQRTYTPSLDTLAAEGVSMTSYYTFKICAPSRASLITGRYPWGAGFYDMAEDPNHCTYNFTALPELLKPLGYQTHAIGKWDVGFEDPRCAPSGRGFDTFFGYYTACQADYWYHGAAGSLEGCGKGINGNYASGANIPCTDLTNSSGIAGGPHDYEPAAASLNGTYNRVLFSAEGARLVAEHATGEHAASPFYLYLAFMNVHDGCAGPYGSPSSDYKRGLQAPLATVDTHYNTTVEDTYKMAGAMVTELDFGVKEVVDALKQHSMWNNTLFVMVSDNGGPLDHSANAPLRGGKHTFWEGGVRVFAMVSGPALLTAGFSKQRMGSSWDGMAHSSDWYMTLVEGVAGGKVPANTSKPGWRAPDGINIWDALIGDTSSPRKEVVHQVVSPYFHEKCSSMRMGEMKIVVGNPGDARTVSWPAQGVDATPFGLTGGAVEPGTDHARASGIGTNPCFTTQCKVTQFDVGGGHTTASAAECQAKCAAHNVAAGTDPAVNGCETFVWIADDGRCGLKGGNGGAPSPQAGTAGGVNHSVCGFATNATCVSKAPAVLCTPFCLFNLTADLAEANDLYSATLSDPALAALAEKIVQRLAYHGSTGGPNAYVWWDKKVFQTKNAATCTQAIADGTFEPLREGSRGELVRTHLKL